jgi:hypothetical protein
MGIKYTTILLSLLVTINVEAAFPNLAGTNLFSGQNTDSNRFTVNGNFISVTNSSAFIPTNNISLSGSTNNYINGTYIPSISSTGAFGLITYTWVNSASITNIYTTVPVNSITIFGNQWLSGVYSGGSWGYHNPLASQSIHAYNGTNFLVWNIYQIAGTSLTIKYDYFWYSGNNRISGYYGWGLYAGASDSGSFLLAQNPVQNIADPSWSSSWTVTPTWGSISSSSYVLGSSSSTTNTDLFTITAIPQFYPPIAQLVLSDSNLVYSKDFDPSNPDGHWTEINGSGDTGVTGLATVNTNTFSGLGYLYVPNIICTTFTLGSKTYTNIEQTINQAIYNIAQSGTNPFAGSGSNFFGGLSVTNWTTNSTTINYTTNTLYTNFALAGILSGFALIISTNNEQDYLTIVYTNLGVGYSKQIQLQAQNYTRLGTPFSIPLNNGSTFSLNFTSSTTNSSALQALTTDFEQLPH